MKALFTVLGILVALMLVGLIGGTRHMKDIREFQIPSVDLSAIPDGEYNGSCNIGRWAITVNVTVKDHQITRVEIPENQTPILPDNFIQELNRAILDRPDPNFDAITGASISSKAYMIAVTDALSK